MNRDSLSKNFNGLVIFMAVIPLMVAAYIFFQSRETWKVSLLVFPVFAYGLFLFCLAVLAYIFKKKRMNLILQMERFRRESERRVIELNALREISELTRDSIPPDDMLKLILDKAMQIISVRNGSVFLVDAAEPEGLRLIAAKPEVIFKKNDDGDIKPHRYSFVKSVIESGKTLRIQDIESDPRTMKSNDPKYGSPSFISMPIYKNKQVVAVVNLANKENGGIFTEGDERIMTIMLGAIGVGIENFSLRNKIKQQLAEIKELNAGPKK